MLEDTAAISELLLHWEDATGRTTASDVASSAGGELLDFFGDLHATFGAPSPGERTEGSRTLSRSSLCRRRQREEIKRLRQEVGALEAYYERLLEGGSVQPRQALDEKDTVETNRPARSAWERIARHQQELKRESECENAKLRGLLNEHRKLAQRIEKAIHNRALEAKTKEAAEKNRERAVAIDKSKATERWKATAASPHWQRMFNIVFNNDSFWLKERERELLSISTDSNGDTVVEGVYSKVFPFDLAKTSQAMWRSYSIHYLALAGGYYSVTSASENILAAEFQVTLDVAGSTLLLNSGVLIHKVHEEPGRVVFVWENWLPTDEKNQSLVPSVDDPSVAKLCMTMDLCVSVEQITRGPPNKAVGNVGDVSPATLTRVYSVSRPSRTGLGYEDPIPVSRDELVRTYHDSNRRFSQLVETYLLDDALGLGTSLTASA